MNITERIRGLIEDNDTKKGKLAEYLGVNSRQLTRYLVGENEMGISKLQKLCEYYGVSADYILGLPRGLEWPRG